MSGGAWDGYHVQHSSWSGRSRCHVQSTSQALPARLVQVSSNIEAALGSSNGALRVRFGLS